MTIEIKYPIGATLKYTDAKEHKKRGLAVIDRFHVDGQIVNGVLKSDVSYEVKFDGFRKWIGEAVLSDQCVVVTPKKVPEEE